jgi:hypothetical protein
MPTLRDLDGQRVTASLPLGRRPVLVTGDATFLFDPVLGPALKLVVDDASGEFAILIKESEWRGKIWRRDEGDFVMELAPRSNFSAPAARF